MHRKIVVLLSACLIALGSIPAAAGETVEFELAAPRVGMMTGDTTYQIGGSYQTPGGSGVTNFPLSELRFPLDIKTVSLNANLAFKTGGGKLVFHGAVLTDITNDPGAVQDSDWTDENNPDTKTIYSESAADLNVLVWDVGARYRFLDRSWSHAQTFLGIGGGYIHQEFDYDVHDVTQTEGGETIMVRGPVGTYEVRYDIPYIELAGGIVVDNSSLTVRLGYSPWVDAKDKDDHLLRSKVAEGNCDGSAVFLDLRYRYQFAKRFFATAGAAFFGIETTGTQKQTRYADTSEGLAGPIGEIEQKIKSNQNYFDIGVGINF